MEDADKNDIHLMISAVNAPAVVVDNEKIIASNALGKAMFSENEWLPDDIDFADDESVQTSVIGGTLYAVTVKKLSQGYLAVFRDAEHGSAGRLIPVANAMSEPVNSLVMAAEAIFEEAKSGGEELRKSAAYIMKSQYMLVRVMREIKETAAMERGEMTLNLTNVILDEMCEKICKQCNALCEPCGVRVVFGNSTRGVVTALDEEKIRRVVLNLISNAVSACAEGGTVTVAVGSENDNASITVTDDGCGMSDEAFATAFTRMEDKLDNGMSEHGMGMGLYFVIRAVHMHGGRVVMSRGRECGTKIAVSIPIRHRLIFQQPKAQYERYPGFNPIMMELSGVLPYSAFMPDEENA